MQEPPAIYAFSGGLDTSTAALAKPPGALIYGMNYEPLAEGYGRMEGYERYDGQTAPSAQIFYRLDFESGTIEIETGDTVTGATSGATGYVVSPPYGVTGAWGAGTAAGSLALVGTTGTFVDGEVLRVGGVQHAVSNGIASESGSPDDTSFDTWSVAAMLWQRGNIDPIPGSGPARGVAVHDGNVYAWRDNVGATACVGHKATASGWQALTASKRIPFTSGGTVEVQEGNTITGATSAATALVVRVVVTDGTWAAGTAEGWIHVINVTGTFGAENIDIGASLNVATVAAATDNTFADGGRIRTISHNFFGASNRYRLYGASGVDRAFELTSNTMLPIFTGMVDDTPQRVFEIGNQLGLTFAGGSVQISGEGEPHDWQVILGAGEIGFGTEVTDVIQANDTAVAIFGEQKIGTLTGNDTANFVLDILTEEAGAEADTAQRIARTVYVDKRGLRSLDATQAFGNFKTGALSEMFEKHFRQKRASGVRAVGSMVSRSKSQYRLFWDDGTGLTVYMGGKVPQAIPFDLGFVPTCFGQGELADGEALFVGDADGYIYRLDSGRNFDGTAIEAVCMTPFNHFKSPQIDKRFHKVTLELSGPSRATISIAAQFDYANLDQPVDDGQQFTVRSGGGFWDQALWNQFSWSDPIEGTAECYIDGIGRNMGMIFATTAALNEEAHVLQAYTVNYSMRKVRR